MCWAGSSERRDVELPVISRIGIHNNTKHTENHRYDCDGRDRFPKNKDFSVIVTSGSACRFRNPFNVIMVVAG